MAYETGTAANLADLFTRLFNFATANGWNASPAPAADRLYLNKGSVFVAFRWAVTTPTVVGIYQGTGLTGGDPHTLLNDSGQGYRAATFSNANFLTSRHVEINNTTAARYWFFATDNDINVVHEHSPDSFRHFGFGEVVKTGSWTGGAYAYGQRFDATQTQNNNPLSSMLLDGCSGFTSDTVVRPHVATIHVEGTPGQAVAGKWGLVWSGLQANTSTDAGGNVRECVQGGFRGGPINAVVGGFGGSVNTAFVPLGRIGLWLQQRLVNTKFHELGFMRNARFVNIRFFGSADEINYSGDTWMVFPARERGTTAAQSDMLGVAYRRVI